MILVCVCVCAHVCWFVFQDLVLTYQYHRRIAGHRQCHGKRFSLDTLFIIRHVNSRIARETRAFGHQLTLTRKEQKITRAT